jgi:hypothetical protein
MKCDFPSGWKTSMIYKGKGDMQDHANYQGISLISMLLKVYMGLLVRLDDWLERRRAISEYQM